MIPLKSLRYHPNSYIASRRSSLPRQGYGGVYERRRNLGFSLTPSPSSNQLQNTRPLPRNFSDFAIRHTAESTSSDASSSKSVVTESLSESSTDLSEPKDDDVEEEERPRVQERPPSPTLTLPCVRLRWRRREVEERRIIRRLEKARKLRGTREEVPSAHFSDLVSSLVGMEVETEEESNDTHENVDFPELDSLEEWNVLITNLVNRKKHVRAILDKEYRDSKRQASQMRHSFERFSERVVSRFDRLISDILCYARLVCHLGRQSTRLWIHEFLSDSSIFIEDKRNLLQQQLSELPRLRHSLLLRQASLVGLCSDPSASNELEEKLSSYWSFAFQLCTIDSEIVLDNELAEK